MPKPSDRPDGSRPRSGDASRVHLDAVGRRDASAVSFDRPIANAGVRVLRSEVPSWRLRPGDTDAVATLHRIRETYGDAVPSAALKVIVAASRPVTTDIARAMARIVRLFPRSAAKPADLAGALATVPLEKLRREASFADGTAGLTIPRSDATSRHLGAGGR